MSAARRPCRASRRSPATSPRAHPGGYPKQTKVYLVSMGEMPARLTDEQLAEPNGGRTGFWRRAQMETWEHSPRPLRRYARRLSGSARADLPPVPTAPRWRRCVARPSLPSRTAPGPGARLRERCSCSVTTSPCNGGMHARCTRDDADGRCSSSGVGLCARVSWRSCPAVSPVRSTRQAWRQRSSARPVSPRSRSPSEETRATSRPPVGGSTDVRCPHA